MPPSPPLRLVIAILLLAACGAIGAAAYAAYSSGPPGETAAYDVEIIGPDGALWAGRVEVENATALSALERAAENAGLTLETDHYPGLGTYVRSIGGHEANGATGWIYEVRREGEWRAGDRSAERFTLVAGDAVRWSWTSG